MKSRSDVSLSKTIRCALPILALSLLAAPAAAQAPSAPAGQFGAVMEYDAGVLPTQTVYRPRDLSRAARIPVVAWGNGGCADNGGASARPFLMQLASDGYLIIAPGKPGPDVEIQPTTNRVAPPAQPPAPPPGAPPPGQAAGPPPGADATQSSQLLKAIDWATAENKRADSIFYNKLDLTKVAVAGHSCGGLQALDVSADPRVLTTLVLNSGIYVRPGGRSGVRIDKTALSKLHGPALYLHGGPTDIAYENAIDDYAKIDKVAVFMGELPVGHGGTFRQANGGAYATVVKAWLDWRLKGDSAGASWFSGASCKLCTDANWKVSRKQIK